MRKLRGGLGAAGWALACFVSWQCPSWAAEQSKPRENPAPPISPAYPGETAQDDNRRLQELQQALRGVNGDATPGDYRIGVEDLLEISVFEAPELNHVVRVSAGGGISLPLVGAVHAAGQTPRNLEFVLQELLLRTFVKDPHVSVFVREMQSHPVSVFGAVRRPGVFQVRGEKTLAEVLSMAEGLAEDAGDTVIVMRGAAISPSTHAADPPEAARAFGARSNTGNTDPTTAASPADLRTEAGTVTIDLKDLLQSSDPRYNVPIYPGDVVKVARAGVIYVVGEVRKPGGFALKTNENISILQALALAEGLTRTSAKSQARVIRTNEATGVRSEIAVNLGKILKGKKEDLMLHPKDILFVPNSASRTAFYRGAEAAVSIAGGIIVYRR